MLKKRFAIRLLFWIALISVTVLSLLTIDHPEVASNDKLNHLLAWGALGVLAGLGWRHQNWLFSALLGLVFTVCVMTGSLSGTGMADATFGLLGFSAFPNAVYFVALLGFANAMCWPSIWPLALSELGRYTSKGAALLIMGIAGGAVLPAVYGLFADAGDGQLAFGISLPAYAFILFYALKGHRIRRWR